MLTVRYTSTFKKDYKRAQKRGQNVGKLLAVIKLLLEEKKLPAIYEDHPLRGNFSGTRDCHIEDDWVLIYSIADSELILHRTGTHSDLFK